MFGHIVDSTAHFMHKKIFFFKQIEMLHIGFFNGRKKTFAEKSLKLWFFR